MRSEMTLSKRIDGLDNVERTRLVYNLAGQTEIEASLGFESFIRSTVGLIKEYSRGSLQEREERQTEDKWRRKWFSKMVASVGGLGAERKLRELKPSDCLRMRLIPLLGKSSNVYDVRSWMSWIETWSLWMCCPKVATHLNVMLASRVWNGQSGIANYFQSLNASACQNQMQTCKTRL